MDMRIFVGLVINPVKGKWFDLVDGSDVDTAFEEIQAMADADVESGGEIGIMDAEPSFLAKVNRSDLNDLVDTLSKHDHMSDDLIVALWGISDDHNELTSMLENGVYGPFDSAGDFAAQQMEESGELENVPESLKNYIDYESMERDWVLGGDYSKVTVMGEGTYFVSNHH